MKDSPCAAEFQNKQDIWFPRHNLKPLEINPLAPAPIPSPRALEFTMWLLKYPKLYSKST